MQTLKTIETKLFLINPVSLKLMNINADRYVKFTLFQKTANSKIDELVIDFGVIR
jgi:hypothetical protein